MVTFTDFCADLLDQHISLMTAEERRQARDDYNDYIAKMRQVERHKSSLWKASDARQLAKFYGGKALTGSARQKAWAEDIRQAFLNSDATSFEEKAELVTCGGFTNSARFWIDNRNVPASKMTARNIVAAYRAVKILLEKHENTLCRTGSPIAKAKARDEINAYRKECGFHFVKNWEWEQ